MDAPIEPSTPVGITTRTGVSAEHHAERGGTPSHAERGGTPTHAERGGSRSGLGDRLRTYLIGVGIGVMLLGMFWMMKRRAVQNQATAPVQQGTSTKPPAQK